MQSLKSVSTALLLAVALSGSAAAAEPVHGVSRAELQAAIANRVDAQASHRAAIQSLLARPEVRNLAAGAGLDLVRAQAAAATLEGPELDRLAMQAAAADAQLAGGSTVVLTTTALLIILLIVILLV